MTRMIYIADDGSMGDAFNMVVVKDDDLTGEEWVQVEDTPDDQRVMKVIELLWGTGQKVWFSNIEDMEMKEIAL
jgi:hypothetical protein